MIKSVFPYINTQVYYTDNAYIEFPQSNQNFSYFIEIGSLDYNSKFLYVEEFPYFLLNVGWRYIFTPQMILEPNI